MGVKFRIHNDGSKDIEVCEIDHGNGQVSVFPATEKLAGTSVSFAESYPAQYSAFKSEKPPVAVKPVKAKPGKAKPVKSRPVKPKARKSK